MVKEQEPIKPSDDITTTVDCARVAECIRRRRKAGYVLLDASWSHNEQAWKLLWDPEQPPPPKLEEAKP